MCGIVGFKSSETNQEDIDLVCEVIRQSKIRGLHSFGLSDGKNFYKEFQVESIVEKVKHLNLKEFIFHNRYSTSGDYKDHNNNQPIILGSSSLVFNGIISQATKEENQIKYGITLSTDNDGEILLHQKNIPEFLDNLSGSFAGLMYLDGKMFHYRNSRRPAYQTVTKNGSIIIASTKDIMLRAGVKTVITETVEGKMVEIV
jgi:glucosamine 6-phosphate synthetase-like amidotransferase/phosphosugar isomerase protein